jgi:hypothetical protein
MHGWRIGVRREREDKEMRLIFCSVRDLLSHVNDLNFNSNIAFLAELELRARAHCHPIGNKLGSPRCGKHSRKIKNRGKTHGR